MSSRPPDPSPEDMPLLARLVEYALAYYRDFVRPAKQYKAPDDTDRAALTDLLAEKGMSYDELVLAI